MRSLSVAVTQMACSASPSQNVERAVRLVERAASRGAQVVVLQELFETPYFCIEIEARHRDAATSVAESAAIRAMQECARRLEVVVPVSFYERDGDKRFNTLAVVDADGSLLGAYRKSHIPDFPAYEEAY
jgi:N-carbamoylputrescine amidase